MQSAALEEVIPDKFFRYNKLVEMERGKPVAILPRVGVCAVIGDETGKCIDVEVMSSFCKGCDFGNEQKEVTCLQKVENSFTLKNV
ncbi:hypothetical protein TNCV_4689741 [Trichonephila clavipes]|nr:hypothetical protein TNCV_4689741 [Trichonephila clavipes]